MDSSFVLLNILFEPDSYSHEYLVPQYLLTKIGVDTVENEPLKVWDDLFISLKPVLILRTRRAEGRNTQEYGYSFA